jgi:hypothetical protein
MVVATIALQIIATSLRWASLSPSMYRCVVWIDRWPANSCTSRSEPPALCTIRAARVTNVRRPECDEQPFRPMFLNARLNHTTISDAVAYDYMERHGRAAWRDIDQKLGQGVSCPKLKSYWHFYGCRYEKASRTCAEPEHWHLSAAEP